MNRTGKTRARLFTISLALLVLAGCGTTGERQARHEWERAYAARPESADSGGDDRIAPADITLASLLEESVRSNRALQAKREDWKAALDRVPQARALPDPNFTYAYFLQSVETRVGPQNQRFGLAQSFPLFGKLGLRGEVAVHEANAAAARFESARLALRERVTKLWNELVYLEHAIAITEENVALLESLEEVLLKEYASGRRSYAHVLKTQIEHGRLEDRVRTLRDRRNPLVQSLRAELDLPPSHDLVVPASAAYTLPYEDDENVKALDANPRIRELEAMIEKARAASDLAGKSAVPDLTLGVEYIVTDKSEVASPPDNGQDAAIAMASVRLPLWLGRYKAEKNEARARMRASEERLADEKNRLRAEWELALFEYRDHGRRIDLYDEVLVPRAEEMYETSTSSFMTGTSDFLDLIDAERTLLEFALARERAAADRANAGAALERLAGGQASSPLGKEDSP
ncbi:MAG: TolC family protein [Gemmatimonadetes bacterium]|nr:TolC family protein [Gemmatimonadota bacterium]